jgi:ABC-type phosphate transport system permease subunit
LCSLKAPNQIFGETAPVIALCGADSPFLARSFISYFDGHLAMMFDASK